MRRGGPFAILVPYSLQFTRQMAIDTSPPIHRLRPEEPFNKELFKKRIQILGIRIPASETTQYVRSDTLKG
jgi:hypothetical protein